MRIPSYRWCRWQAFSQACTLLSDDVTSAGKCEAATRRAAVTSQTGRQADKQVAQHVPDPPTSEPLVWNYLLPASLSYVCPYDCASTPTSHPPPTPLRPPLQRHDRRTTMTTTRQHQPPPATTRRRYRSQSQRRYHVDDEHLLKWSTSRCHS